MHKNLRKCKNSKKPFFRWCSLWSQTYWQADKEFRPTCAGTEKVQKHKIIFSKPAITGNLQYTGKKAIITSNPQSTGKEVTVLHIKAETSKDHPVPFKQQQREPQEQQTQDKARTYNKTTGKNISFKTTQSYYAPFSQTKLMRIFLL